MYGMGIAAALSAWLFVAGPVAATEPQWFKDGFHQLSLEERQNVQQELASVGLYNGDIDGVYGPGTEEGLGMLPDYLAANTIDHIVVELENAGDVHRFVKELGQGLWTGYLMGEDGEGV